MKNPWDTYAIKRHEQIISGQDISYDYVLIKTIIEFLNSLQLGEKSKILDIGCSTGILISRINRPTFDITGIDNSRTSIRIAQKYLQEFNNVKLIQESIIRFLPFKHDFFDIIIANMVFHTVDNYDAALSSCYRLLKKKGNLIISLPHPRYWFIYQGIDKTIPYDYEIPKKYYLDFRITNDQSPFPEKVPYIHRPISFYVNGLINAGFIIRKISEPIPDEKTMSLYKQAWKEPHFLFIHAYKEENNGTRK